MLNITTLLLLYAPIVYFHPNEKYFPTTVENVYNSIYYKSNVTIPWTVYAHADPIRENPHIFRLWYAFLYSFNKAYLKIGDHFGDLEHISIYVNIHTKKIIAAYLSAHSFQSGTWLDIFYTNKIIVYIAKGTHAIYPKPHIYQRIFGFANDECSNKGFKWQTHINIIKDQWWIREDLILGDSLLPNKHYMYNNSLDKNILNQQAFGNSWLYRFFYIFFYLFDNT